VHYLIDCPRLAVQRDLYFHQLRFTYPNLMGNLINHRQNQRLVQNIIHGYDELNLNQNQSIQNATSLWTPKYSNMVSYIDLLTCVCHPHYCNCIKCMKKVQYVIKKTIKNIPIITVHHMTSERERAKNTWHSCSTQIRQAATNWIPCILILSSSCQQLFCIIYMEIQQNIDKHSKIMWCGYSCILKWRKHISKWPGKGGFILPSPFQH